MSPEIVFNDGKTHIINYFEEGSSYSIYDNVNAPHNPTTAIFLDGKMSFLDVHQNSIIYLLGGNMSSILAYDQSTVIIEGGATGTSHAFFAYDDSKVTITGGDVLLGDFGGSKLLIAGGGVTGFNILGDQANIYGGNINPGVIENVRLGSVDMNIYGGHFAGSLLFYARTSDIYGGTWRDSRLDIYGNVLIHGRNFNMPPGTYTAGDDLSGLTGILADGTPLSFSGLQILDSGTVTLVSEPATMLHFRTELAGLAALRRKFRKQRKL